MLADLPANGQRQRAPMALAPAATLSKRGENSWELRRRAATRTLYSMIPSGRTGAYLKGPFHA